ncbi:hypothetical protein IWQ57_000079 [Coemansia nantahalensis]|uniref:Uncharacterized protein n=1 Tax=Coemansia nantahalensis TaxID=2789366 RepID=A0ACC1K9M9_9FUNG|nr:hypothetical protein IWQ57_000079 [Coemansia nantahalensis]
MGAKKTKGSRGGLEEIGGYRVLPVRMGDDEDSAIHHLYFRQHSSTRDAMLLPEDRTLFLANLPVDATERDIRRLFRGVARVARVVFNGVAGQDVVKSAAAAAKMTAELATAMASAAAAAQKGKASKKKGAKDAGDDSEPVTAVPRAQLLVSGSSAHVVLLETEELAKVLDMKAGTIAAWPARDSDDASSPLEYRGLARYIYEHRAARPPMDLLKAEVDSFMAKFEESQYERERMLTQQHNVPDADGFVTVVRRGRNTKNSDGAGSVTAASVEDARAAGAKKKEVVFGNMYRFQVRERKNNQLVELRKKFEEDKERIARMRQSRQFRPY